MPISLNSLNGDCMKWQVPLADLDYGPAEEKAVVAVLQRRWLTMGLVTQKFEREFAAFLGVKHAFALSNPRCLAEFSEASSAKPMVATAYLQIMSESQSISKEAM